MHKKEHKTLWKTYQKMIAAMGSVLVMGVGFAWWWGLPVSSLVHFFYGFEKGDHRSFSFYVAMPEVLINLYPGPDKRSSFLKLSLVVEVANAKEAEIITRHIPKIVDEFQIYLHELRASDLKGAEGVLLLKEQLSARIHKHVEDFQVKNLLIKEMLIQ